mmetsp:Transcript_79893/g.166112  ORF Transcript_79893/g.166112 Transcript_79893/m.166112 type:complete len:93 (+) Transcript_79893:54-332(+)
MAAPPLVEAAVDVGDIAKLFGKLGIPPTRRAAALVEVLSAEVEREAADRDRKGAAWFRPRRGEWPAASERAKDILESVGLVTGADLWRTARF